jgi:hypothetical protein
MAKAKKVREGEDAFASTRDARATQGGGSGVMIR